MSRASMIGVGRSISKILATMFAAKALLPYGEQKRTYSETAFRQREKSVRNPKDPIKKAAIARRRKATKLGKLSKPKRRAVYYYNLRHSACKMYT